MDLQLVSPHPTTIINDEALEEWQEYRTEKKKPLSALALKKSKNLLLKFGFAHQAHIVDTAIMNDWQGLHPVEMPRITTSPTRNTDIRDDLNDTSWAH
jgi:hypothetical protein